MPIQSDPIQNESKSIAIPDHTVAEQQQPKLSGLASAIVSGIAAALVGLIGNYWITLKQVEEPKILLEEKKTLLEAHRQILSLAPRVETSCSSSRWSNAEWRIECSSKNVGVYPTMVRIEEVTLQRKSDPTRKHYQPGEGFTIYHPNEKKSFLNPAGTPAGVLEIFLMFPAKTYENAALFNDYQVNVQFRYSPVESATSKLAETFPDQANLVKDVATQPSESVPVSLFVTPTQSPPVATQ
jgi:hypothetical protein